MTSKDRWLEVLESCENFLIYDKDKSICYGEISWSNNKDGSVNLNALAILPEFQKKGIGSSIMVDFLKNNSEKRITLSTHRDNSIAIKLYESFGFKVIGETTNYKGEPKVFLELLPEIDKNEDIFDKPTDAEIPQVIKKLEPEEINKFLKNKESEINLAGISNSGGLDEIKIESKLKPNKVKFQTLLKTYRDSIILKNLGVMVEEEDGSDYGKVLSGEDHIFTIEEIISFLMQQMQLENGSIKVTSPIKPDAYPANIFYVKDFDGKVRSFRCYFNPKDYKWNIASKDFNHEWQAGAIIFSRN